MKPVSWIRKTAVFVIGATLVAIGAALLFLPGPGTVVGGIGLAVLATEFWWARRLIKRAKGYGDGMIQAARGRLGMPVASDTEPPPKAETPPRE